MITITDAITIMIITIAIITLSISIISHELNTHTYADNRLEPNSRSRCNLRVRDLLSTRSNCLPFLQNLRLQLWTPWMWSIMRSSCGRCAKAEVQTMILTDVTISANIHHQPPTTRCWPPASPIPVPGGCNSASLWTEHTGAYMGA